MTTAATGDTRNISQDTSIIKECMMKVVEQLARQDEILEQIAWIRAVVCQRPGRGDDGSNVVMDNYLNGMTDYVGSVCGDTISDVVAEEMHHTSQDAVESSGPTSSTPLNDTSSLSSVDEPDAMTIVVGNTHRLVTPQIKGSSNKHLWTFYLQASGEEIIQEVVIYLVRLR